jgi:hypothetical protein
LSLQHKEAKKNPSAGAFAHCPHCPWTWSNKELIKSYLIHGMRIPGLTNFPNLPANRLKAMAVEYQKVKWK